MTDHRADHRAALGLAGENAAAAHLLRLGYEVLARRWRSRSGEIDIIAREGGELVFIEVRTRSGHTFDDALESINARKRAQLIRVANDYLDVSGLSDECCRFDAAAVIARDGLFTVEITRDALDW